MRFRRSRHCGKIQKFRFFHDAGFKSLKLFGWTHIIIDDWSLRKDAEKPADGRLRNKKSNKLQEENVS